MYKVQNKEEFLLNYIEPNNFKCSYNNIYDKNRIFKKNVINNLLEKLNDICNILEKNIKKIV